MKASVSIVIPCFRCTRTIKLAVLSVARQTIRPYEIILVDDASGDRTLAILQALSQQYPGWIKVIELNQNGGAASARNAGWQAASQSYVAFLDADDTWHPEKIRIQYEYMCSNPEVAMSGHQCICLVDDEMPPKIPTTPAVTELWATGLIFRSPFSTPTVMLKRDIAFRFTENKRFAEDLYLWQQIAFAGLRVMRIESPLAFVHKALYGEGGLSAQMWKMEKGELSNLVSLYQAGSINWFLLIVATWFSITKYAKRLLVTRSKLIASLLRRKGDVL